LRELFKTLKQEEIYANNFHDLEHLLESDGTFIDHYYNQCRLRSALGYRSPDELEKEFGPAKAAGSLTGPVLRFFNSEDPPKRSEGAGKG
jgi:hypothetical protein